MNKRKIGFIVDSSLGLFGDEIGYDNVRQVFFNITDSDHNEYLDNNVDIKVEDVLEKFKNGKTFQTSAVSPGTVIVALEELLEQYEKVILLTISSGLSSFHDNIKFLEEEYKDKFYVVDTKEVGYGINYLLTNAQKMVDQGKSAEEIVKYCSEQYKHNFTNFTCESWEPLSKSGRAPKILSKVLNTIHTRPVINFYIKNRLAGIVLGKGEKGFHKAFEKMMEFFKKTFATTESKDIEYIVFYNNGILQERKEFIKQRLCEIFQITKERIIETFTPNLVFVYTGLESYGIHIKSKKEATDRE